MKFTPALVAKLQAEVDSVHEGYTTLRKEEKSYAHVAARAVIARIPGEVVRAILERRNAVDLCEISECTAATTTELFQGERLFYSTPIRSEYLTFDWDVSLSSLIGAAKMVLNYCVDEGLTPSIGRPYKKSMTANGRTASWSACKFGIVWNPDIVTKLLKLEKFE